MSFNADTYYANKWKRVAAEQLGEARAIKARVAAGTAYEWEAPRIAMYVKLARGSARIARSYRELKAIKKGKG